jgi:hypothetical protein
MDPSISYLPIHLRNLLGYWKIFKTPKWVVILFCENWGTKGSLILNFIENSESELTTKLKNSPTLVCTICWLFTAEYWFLGQNLLQKRTHLFATKRYCGDSLSLSSTETLSNPKLALRVYHDLTFCSIQPHTKDLCPLVHLLKTHHPNRLTRARHA